MAMFMATSSGRGTPKWVHLRRIPLQDDPQEVVFSHHPVHQEEHYTSSAGVVQCA